MGQRLLLIAFLLILGVFGGLVVRKYLVKTPEQVPQPIVVTEQPAVLRDVLLYFATPDGSRLAAEGREIEDCLTDEDCILAILGALIDGPVGELGQVVPSHTRVLSAEVSDDLVTLDLSREFVLAHPGGSHAELLTVYAIVDTLSVNFPYLRQVSFLVEGKPLQTIKGHVDLRAPIAADFRYARPDERLPELPSALFEVPADESPDKR